jgi:hypothetical protein
MKQDKILESLSKLDPENNDHWTQNGQPLLSAVGEGVTRSQIIEVAPLFSRENPELPSVEEVPPEPTYQDLVAEFQAKLAEAQAALELSLKMQSEADEEVKRCHQVLEDLRDAQRNSDKRSDTEINQDLIYADLNRRLAKAQDHARIRQFMDAHGVNPTDVNLLSMGPADRAIARRNIESRKQRR